jgi:hypothetical protein
MHKENMKIDEGTGFSIFWATNIGLWMMTVEMEDVKLGCFWNHK